jgi:Electron transfer DM13
MKPIIPFALLLALGLLAGCQSKEETVDPVVAKPTTPGSSTVSTAPSAATAITPVGMTITPASMTTNAGKLLATGQFMNNAHSVSGTVQVYEKNGFQTLVFTNFKTDGGPDLRIYLAENTGLRNFIEVSKIVNAQSFSISLDPAAFPDVRKNVLIWCKPFSVLFGSAELKPN